MHEGDHTQTAPEPRPETVTPKEDNWAGRGKGMKCKTCMAYVVKKDKIGRCRFNAPTMRGWPVMWESDYCMQHKLDETKI